MKTGLSVVTAPTEEPVTLEELKNYFRVVASDENDLITSLGQAARSLIEDQTGRVALNTVFKYTLAGFPCRTHVIDLPRCALQSVTHVKYYDADGVLQTLDSSQYIVIIDDEPGYVYLRDAYSWPTTEVRPAAVEIQFTAGWAASQAALVALDNDPSEGFRLAIRMLANHWFELRGTVQVGNLVSSVPKNFDDLVRQFRVFHFE